jgi:allantoinase
VSIPSSPDSPDSPDSPVRSERGGPDARLHDLVVRADAVYTPDGPRPGAVVVDGGTVTAVLPPDTPVAARDEIRLAADEVLIPGVVDSHVHVNEPGRGDWEGFASATLAAAAGGVTTIVDMPLNSIPPTTTVSALDLKRRTADGRCAVDVGFWAGAVPENLGTLEALHEAGAFGFKAFLSPSGVPEFGHLSPAELMQAAAEIAGFGGLLIVHAEDPAVLDQAEAEAETAATAMAMASAETEARPGGPAQSAGPDAAGYARFLAGRPDHAETSAIGQVIEAVRETGVRAHILHLSSARALPLLARAKAEGLPVTVETCPHYLSFAAEEIPRRATEFKCCPPIRSAANRELLWQGLAAGVIDLIASDHSPATAELKFAGGGDFGRAWGGIAGLQVALPAVWTAARARGLPLEAVLGWMCRAPARLTGLADKGRIEPGARADLVAFAPAAGFRVSAGELRHKNPVSAFDGAELTGTVRRTWLAGRPAGGTGQPDPAPPAGRLLTRP